MEPLAGHRRRRSSLMNPAGPAIAGAPGATGPGGVGAGGIGAPGVQGQRTVGGLQIQTTNLLADEPKIVEEGANEDETGRLLPGSSRHGSRADDGSESWSSDNDVRDDEETGLTSSERKKRRMRRKKNTRLDQRIVRDGITAEEKKEADQNVARRLAINGLFIGLWYFFSLMISIYNKWMFGKGKLNFAFPLFTTSLHMLVQFTLASVILYLFPSLRPKRGRQSPSDRGRSRHSSELDKQPLMTKMFYLTRIGPCGAATGLDIGLGNMSLKFITLTFYTMCKSSTLAFVLTFAFIFGLEKPTWRLIGIIGTMTIGVVMMVTGEVSFHLGGFALIISAAFFSGFRWGLTQMLLLRNPATSNPFSSIFFLAPVMFLTLICIAIPAEGPIALYHGFGQLIADRGPVLAPLILIFPGCIAFAMTVSEFALLQRTSVVTLSIAGICKEVVTIIAAALVFGDTLTPINFVGLITTIGAISAYNWIKITKMRSEAQTDVHRAHMPPPSASISASAGASPIISDDEPVSAVSFRRSGDYDEPLVTASGDIVPNLSPPARHEDDTRRPAAA
jgi:solute carrier family 35 protein C2